jgi:hypothetical protein
LATHPDLAERLREHKAMQHQSNSCDFLYTVHTLDK